MVKVRSAVAAWGLVLSLFFVFTGARVHAQGGPTGALTGSVQDSTGAIVAGAEVKVVNTATRATVRSDTTNSSGVFTVTLLPAGAYTVQVNSPGFGGATVGGIEVRVTETTQLIVTLNPKSVTQRVEVHSEAVTVNTSDATTGQSLGGQEIRDLPLATRNFQQLLALSPGASSSLNAAAQLGRGVVKIQVNGGGKTTITTRSRESVRTMPPTQGNLPILRFRVPTRYKNSRWQRVSTMRPRAATEVETSMPS